MTSSAKFEFQNFFSLQYTWYFHTFYQGFVTFILARAAKATRQQSKKVSTGVPRHRAVDSRGNWRATEFSVHDKALLFTMKKKQRRKWHCRVDSSRVVNSFSKSFTQQLSFKREKVFPKKECYGEYIIIHFCASLGKDKPAKCFRVFFLEAQRGGFKVIWDKALVERFYVKIL